MTDSFKSTCIRCGKQRIVIKTWTEMVGLSSVTYSDTSCPDIECQKVVERDLKNKFDKLNKIKENSQRNREAHMAKRKEQKKILPKKPSKQRKK